MQKLQPDIYNPKFNTDTVRQEIFVSLNSTSTGFGTDTVTYNDWDDRFNRYYRGLFVVANVTGVSGGSGGVLNVTVRGNSDNGIILAALPSINATGTYWLMMHPDVKQNTNNYTFGILPLGWDVHFAATGDKVFDGYINSYYIP